MGMTILEKNLQILTNGYDESTKVAGTILREISRDVFRAKSINEAQLNQALENTCPEAKPTAQMVVSLIKAIRANQ